MQLPSLRALALPAAIALGACAGMVPITAAGAAPASAHAHATKASAAGSGYYGVWILKSWDMSGQVLPCPVQLNLPAPAPSISCTDTTYLKLFRSGKYETTIPAFDQMTDTGMFGVVALSGGRGSVIVFDDNGEQDAPRAYRMSLSPAGAKSPTKMAIWLTMYHAGVGHKTTMNYVRYTG